MRGPADLNEIINGVLREAKTASVREVPAASSTPANLRKLAGVLRMSRETPEVTYGDVYTVKEALYAR